MAGKEKALNQITSEREGKQKQPASFNDFVKFGKKYARKGKYKRAIQSFGQASKIGTDDFKARTALVAEVKWSAPQRSKAI
jgi:cytochrome c-type biogenesis protein CcmH/NrfG